MNLLDRLWCFFHNICAKHRREKDLINGWWTCKACEDARDEKRELRAKKYDQTYKRLGIRSSYEVFDK